MKKIIIMIIGIISIFTYQINVSAQDNVISMNKYQEETFHFINNSYNEKLENDGFILGGKILKETIEEDDEEYNDYQAIIVKYKKDGKLSWKYTYGKNGEDDLDYLDYTYDSEGNIDGYLMVLQKSKEINSDDKVSTIFLKIDFEGKLVWEKETGLSSEEKINKIISTTNDDGIVNGYIAIANGNNRSYLIKYDKELKIVWKKESKLNNYKEINYIDLEKVSFEKTINGYVVLVKYIDSDNKTKIQLVRFDKEGNNSKVVNDKVEKYNSYYLKDTNNGYILYGATKDVKLKKGQYSYYIINYDSNDEPIWETIGDTPVDYKEKIILLPKYKDNELNEYLLLSYNNINKCSEVVTIDLEGSIKEKVKKINSEYYNIEDFITEGKVLYFVGQINCPEDDTCDYDSNSLFLISDEDKVIEVKDNDSKNIIIVIVVLIILSVGAFFIKAKKEQH